MSLQTHIDRINEIAKDATIQMLLLTDPEIISWKSYYRVRYGKSDEEAHRLASMAVGNIFVREEKINQPSETRRFIFSNHITITHNVPTPKIFMT